MVYDPGLYGPVGMDDNNQTMTKLASGNKTTVELASGNKTMVKLASGNKTMVKHDMIIHEHCLSSKKYITSSYIMYV